MILMSPKNDLKAKLGRPIFKVRSDRITVIFLMDKEKRFMCNWTIFENMQANLPIKTSQLSICTDGFFLVFTGHITYLLLSIYNFANGIEPTFG